MKKIKKQLFFYLLPVIVSLFLLSCGDTTSPTNDTLFSQDSLSIWFDSGMYQIAYDSVVFGLTDNTVKRITVEYTVQSNVDSVYSYGAYGVSANTETILPPPVYLYHPIDQYFKHTLDIPIGFRITWLIGLAAGNNTSMVYIRLRNMKITRI